MRVLTEPSTAGPADALSAYFDGSVELLRAMADVLDIRTLFPRLSAIAGKMLPHDYVSQQRTSAAGQYPAAVVLGCVDSRAPAEVLFDVGICDTFNARIAGNVVNDDLLGSMEFACAVAGAKAVVVFGHTACGAVKGAIDDVEMGNLTGLLARIKPAITATTFSGEKSSRNAAYVDAVAHTNVALTLDNIRRRSPLLADLEKKGSIRIAGAMYDLATGNVEFVA